MRDWRGGRARSGRCRARGSTRGRPRRRRASASRFAHIAAWARARCASAMRSSCPRSSASAAARSRVARPRSGSSGSSRHATVTAPCRAHPDHRGALQGRALDEPCHAPDLSPIQTRTNERLVYATASSRPGGSCSSSSTACLAVSRASSLLPGHQRMFASVASASPSRARSPSSRYVSTASRSASIASSARSVR